MKKNFFSYFNFVTPVSLINMYDRLNVSGFFNCSKKKTKTTTKIQYNNELDKNTQASFLELFFQSI